jgi:SsrA-binding protein
MRGGRFKPRHNALCYAHGMNLIEHKRVRYDFEILETIEAGIVLIGSEIKAIRNHQGKLEGAHIVVRGGEAFLVGAHIPAFQYKNALASFDPDRTRTLLVHKGEIKELLHKNETRGLTLVPLALYSKKKHIKVAVGIARGKKKADKREKIKERDTKRDIDRLLKRQHK